MEAHEIKASSTEAFVYEALTCPHSYAGGGKAQEIRDMPHWKGYRVIDVHHSCELQDRYWVGTDGSSAGQTCLWINGAIAMQMSYGGNYPKHVTGFLKQVLKTAYVELRDSVDFRGPRDHTNTELGPQYEYTKDHTTPPWRAFRGTERIIQLGATPRDNKQLGYHLVQGFTTDAWRNMLR